MKDCDKSGTSTLSRDHAIQVSDSGLVTGSCGKWTTYRKMAQDAVDQAESVARLMATELRCDDTWQQRQVRNFLNLARGYLPG